MRVRTTVSAAAATAAAFASFGFGVAPAGAAAAADAPYADSTNYGEVVRSTSPASDRLAAASPEGKAEALGRCFTLETELYCLGQGFVSETPNYRNLGQMVREGTPRHEQTGDLSFGDWVSQRAQLTDEERIAAETAEVEAALAGVEKARATRMLVESGASPRKRAALLSNAIMGGYQTRQERSYWCGPATMQSIDWANDTQKDTQGTWASEMGTTSNGTAISELVGSINRNTTWDVAAGTYIVQSVSGWSTSTFYDVHRNHLGDSDPAPIVEHPQLLKQYFPYLHHDHSGHFQVGRGYYTNSSGTKVIKIFEVFNEADWSSVGYTTWGPRDVSASNMLAATKAHPMHNIGY